MLVISKDKGLLEPTSLSPLKYLVESNEKNFKSCRKNKAQIQLPCLKCKASNKSGRSTIRYSISELHHHLTLCHPIPKQKNDGMDSVQASDYLIFPTTSDYILLLKGLSIFIELTNFGNDEHLDFLKLISMMLDMEAIRF